MALRNLRDVVVKMMYPPGSVYITTQNITAANMNLLLPDPDHALEWVQIEGRMLRQANDAATSLGSTGGYYRTQLVAHAHGLASGGNHTHTCKSVTNRMHTNGSGTQYVWQSTLHSGSNWVNSGTGAHTHGIANGGAAPGNTSNLPVYIVVKMFKRVKNPNFTFTNPNTNQTQTFYFQSGMTWTQWCSSVYRPSSSYFYIDSNTSYVMFRGQDGQNYTVVDTSNNAYLGTASMVANSACYGIIPE